MKIDPEICYRALVARDRRFDGVFFVGVTTTRIYCRPICPVRTPRRERCRFFTTAAAAEQEFFRPCLRCRPELAPGNGPMDSVPRAAWLAAARIDAGALDGEGSIESLAMQLGMTSRQLRRVTRQELGVTPIQLAQTRRLLLAKQLLTDTDLSIIDVAFASGFSSLRRFNSSFKSHYRLAPSDLRRSRVERGDAPIVLKLPVRLPFAWSELIAFLGARAAAGVEAVEGDSYRRAVRLTDHRGWFAVEPTDSPHFLRVELSTSLVPVLNQVLCRIRQLFDLGARPEVIYASLVPDPVIGFLAKRWPGLRVPGAFDEFEVSLRTIVGQQVSVSAASTIMSRLVAKFGETVVTPFPLRVPCQPPLRGNGCGQYRFDHGLRTDKKRAETIVQLARAMADRRLQLGPGMCPDKATTTLIEMPGIGEWTAQYLVMRTLRWPDAFPATDLVLRRVLGQGSVTRALEVAERWRPWRAYGAMYAWKLANFAGG
ncbi:MAG: AlkA N-terminal domain-containing protein [Planctomycetota bacterium]